MRSICSQKLLIALFIITCVTLIIYLKSNLASLNVSDRAVENHKAYKSCPDNLSCNDAVLSPTTLYKLNKIIGCNDRELNPAVKQRGNYWVFHNYIKADHGLIACYSAVTYTTVGDPLFLDNLITLIDRWRNPVSVAVYTPGSDFALTVSIIRYLRDCTPKRLVKTYATFHLFFEADHVPENIINVEQLMDQSYDCSRSIPGEEDKQILYRYRNNLTYPINVARNIAWESAITHYVFASDIEQYPSPNLAERFLNMIARNEPPLDSNNPRVFVVSHFEIKEGCELPNTKEELVNMIHNETAIPFHKHICDICHRIPNQEAWFAEPDTQKTEVFYIGKRRDEFRYWEPFFISTRFGLSYDERLHWEGKSDKMTIGYLLCVMDYDLMILNNVFLTHKPGFKLFNNDTFREPYIIETKDLIEDHILPEMKIIYGDKEGCII